MATIENWRLVNRRELWVSPQRGERMHVLGEIHGHADHRSGALFCTLPIKDFCGTECHTESGVSYELGEPHPAYESEFPHARNALKARFNKKQNVNHKEKAAC